jgi:hypothetical protein
MTDREPRTAAANAARRMRTEEKLGRVGGAIRHLQRKKIPVTYPAVAARAGVSRTFLYDNAAARALIGDAITRSGRDQASRLADADAQQETSWRERALNAEAGLRTAHAEIRGQRHRIGELLGQLRTMESDLTDDTIQRITTENTTLKQRVRQVTTDNRALEDRLQAARSNARFLDRRIADLEAQLAEAHTSPKLAASSPAAQI